MPFCANCGAPVEGRFCAKCGAPMAAATGGTGPSPEPPPYAPPPAQSTSAAGLEDNVAGALCYVLGLVTGIIFLVIAPYNKSPFVRFHAFQSIFLHLGFFVLWIALVIVRMTVGLALHFGLLFFPLFSLFWLFGFVLWIYCMYKAYNREKFMLPIIGRLAEQQASH